MQFNTTDNSGLSDNLTAQQVVDLLLPLFEIAEVDRTVSATFGLTTADIHNNGQVVQFTDKVLEAGWSRSANVISYSGNPYAVNMNLSINAADVGASAYWARPKIRIIRNGTIIAVMDDLVMQQTGAYNGDFTLSGVFYDKKPGTNPSYTFEWFDEENRTATLRPETYSQISMIAVEKIKVLLAS